MLVFRLSQDQTRVIGIASDDHTREVWRDLDAVTIARNNLPSFEAAAYLAEKANEFEGEPGTYIPTDGGSGRYPRYDVIRAPQVGDLVSAAFNGDSYPEGEIVKISASLRRVETSTGVVFWRRKRSGAWIARKTWSMTPGHVHKRNPSF